MRHSPKAHVLMTELSYYLAGRVLHNSVNVMLRQREEHGIREYPLFTHDQVEESEAEFQGFKYNRQMEWGPRGKSRRGRTLRPPWSFSMPATRSAPPESWCAENRKRFFTPATFVSTIKPSSSPRVSTAFRRTF